MRHKSKAFPTLTIFVKMTNTRFWKKVKVVKTDKALEFHNYQCKRLFEDHEIIHQTCANRAQKKEQRENTGTCWRWEGA